MDNFILYVYVEKGKERIQLFTYRNNIIEYLLFFIAVLKKINKIMVIWADKIYLIWIVSRSTSYFGSLTLQAF